MEMENIARASVKQKCPSAFSQNGVTKLIRGSYEDSIAWNDDDNFPFSVLPDGYFHFWFPIPEDNQKGVDLFILCEIENTNKLSIHKLHEYASLWDQMYYNLRLWTFDRYGKFTTEVDLSYWYLHRFKKKRGFLEEYSNPYLDIDCCLFPTDDKYDEKWCELTYKSTYLHQSMTALSDAWRETPDKRNWLVADEERKKYLRNLDKYRKKRWKISREQVDKDRPFDELTIEKGK